MSETFTFRPLLRLRKRHEDISRQEFAAAGAEVAKIQMRLGELRAALTRQNDVARRVIHEQKSPALGEYRHCVEDLLAAIDREQENLKQATQVLAARQEELAEAMKQRQAIAAVQDKFDHIAAADQDRRDTKEQDDQHASHSARKQA